MLFIYNIFTMYFEMDLRCSIHNKSHFAFQSKKVAEEGRRERCVIQSLIYVLRDIKSCPRNTRRRSEYFRVSELTRCRRFDLRVILVRVTQYMSLRRGTLIPYSPRPEISPVLSLTFTGRPSERWEDRANVTGMARRSYPLRFARYRHHDLVGSSRRRSFPLSYFPIESIVYGWMRSAQSNDHKFLSAPLFIA